MVDEGISSEKENIWEQKVSVISCLKQRSILAMRGHAKEGFIEFPEEPLGTTKKQVSLEPL